MTREIRQLRTRIAYENPHIRVHEDIVRHPTGKETAYGVVEFRPGIGVLAADDRRRVLLLGQYRYPVRAFCWEIVNGTVEEGESPEAAARRELREEGGVEAAELISLGWYYPSAGITTEVCYLFLARGLTAVGGAPDATEQFEARWVAYDEALAMVERSELVGASTVLALLKAQRYLSGG